MQENTSAVLEAVGLKCVRNEQTLFERLCFSVQAGEVLQVDGPNGSGKTSLLRLLCGLSAPSDGEVRWRGRPIGEIRDDYAREISYVGHSNGIKAELTPHENLAVARSLAAPRPDASVAKVLARMELSALAGVPVRRLSSGQCRRVALARLLLSNGRLWFLDEPFTTLDGGSRDLVRELISDHAAAGGITVIVTHEPLDLAGDRVSRITLPS